MRADAPRLLGRAVVCHCNLEPLDVRLMSGRERGLGRRRDTAVHRADLPVKCAGWLRRFLIRSGGMILCRLLMGSCLEVPSASPSF